MSDYTVTWTIELDAETPLDAARIAQEIQRDPQGQATVFVVEPEGTGRAYTIDTETFVP